MHPFFFLLFVLYLPHTFEWEFIIVSEGSCDTEDWSNDAENVNFASQV